MRMGARRFEVLFCWLLAAWLASCGADALRLDAAESGARVPALAGDGIFRLLRRHGLDPEESLQDFIRLNRDTLGPNQTLVEGRQYVLPAASRELVEPLFGRGQQRVAVADQQLRGAVLYLISGHGGPDPGGMGKLDGHTLCEDEYAYDVMLRLARSLMQHGAKVHIVIQDPNDGIREGRFLKPDKDERCEPGGKIPSNQRRRLDQRSRAVNSLAKQDASVAYRRCIIIHVDARRKAEDIDIFFYHQEGNRPGRRLAETLRRTIKEKYQANQPGRGYEGSISTRGLYVLNHIDIPVVFIELGNIHHPRDQARLLEANNRQAVANWLSDGVLADFRSGR